MTLGPTRCETCAYIRRRNIVETLDVCGRQCRTICYCHDVLVPQFDIFLTVWILCSARGD